MDGVLVTLGDDGETVVFASTGIKLGHIENGDVREVLKQLRYDQMSGKLTKRIFKVVEDEFCCPVCGGTNFYSQQELKTVSYGFCQDCQTTAHILKFDDGSRKWTSYPERRPYRRIVNTLYEKHEYEE